MHRKPLLVVVPLAQTPGLGVFARLDDLYDRLSGYVRTFKNHVNRL